MLAHEHWLVSEWLGRELSKRNEIVGNLFGFTIWGRSTTGQAVHLDEVIQEIHTEHELTIQRGCHAR